MLRILQILLFAVSFAVIAQTSAVPKHADPIVIHLLGVNDFHGQITAGRRFNDRPVGSAAVLAAYLKQAQKGKENSTVIAFMGDQIGASTPASGLLNDEPSMLFFNSLSNSYCTHGTVMHPKCNMVATIGNHEFDKTTKNLFEMINGRDTPPTDHWIDLPKYPGAIFPFISANIVETSTGKLLFPPYVIKQINGVSIGFIGAILKNAPDVIMPSNIKNISFLEEADAINHYIPELKAQGAQVIVVLIHQGGKQVPYEGPTQDKTLIEGAIVDIVKNLDDSVDVVMSGHTHNFTNGFLSNQHGKKMLVTQASSYSMAFADVTLMIDPTTHKVVKESAEIIPTYADQWPGTTPDVDTQKLVGLAEAKTNPIINAEIGLLKNDLIRQPNEAGESALGEFVADAAKLAVKADIAVYQPGGVRADLFAGKITWGNAYAVAPFGNAIVKLQVKGQDIVDLLEQQWQVTVPKILNIAGLRYSYDLSQPIGHRVVSVLINDKPLVRDKTYSMAAPFFLALGGDGFSVMKRGEIIESGPVENESLVSYIKSLPQPFAWEMDGRINKF